MNRDQVKGSIKDAAGKAQEKAGKPTGSTGQQVKGLAKQAAPGFDKDAWPRMADETWAMQVHSYCKAKPYWQ